MPLDVQAADSKIIRKGVFPKIENTLENACAQLEKFDGADVHVVYLAINLSIDISFLWPEDFLMHLNQIIEDSKRKGIEVLCKEVGYL